MDKKAQINVLPQELINIIAAGEVVERPSSVVKELLENSIDAESTFIRVNLKNFGKDLIEIIDDGIGMEKRDALIAFQQHSTSKISSKEDLENIISYGFRGEALASISAVSERSELNTKANNSSPISLTIESGKIIQSNSTKSDRGTKISIYNLFKNVPARKKFLKTDNTELRNIISTFIDISLINIHIHFEIYHDDKLIHRLTKATSIKDRIFEIWGKNMAESFLDEKNIDATLCKMDLLLEDPEKSKKNTNFQYIYVNGRRIDSKVIHSAVKEAYQGFIHRDLKPSFLVIINMDPHIVDVNVHPRKLEVRFEDPQAVFRTVYSAVKKTLENTTKESISETIGEIQRNSDYSFAPKKEYGEKSFSFKSTYKTPNPNSIIDAISFSKEIMSPIEETTSQENLKVHQIFNTYIVYEKDDYIVFIDQHAAAEKINFERLIYQVGEVRTKPLLVPTVIELKAVEKEIIMNSSVNLKDVGIVIEDFGGNEIHVSEIPEIIEKIDLDSYFHEILNSKDDFNWISKEYSDVQLSKEIYSLLALTACHGSIRAGEKLSEIEMLNVINDLKNLKQPNNCPHGRPTSWKLKRTEIEKNFKRVI